MNKVILMGRLTKAPEINICRMIIKPQWRDIR